MTMVHKRTGRTGTSPDAAAGPATASGGGRSAAEFTATVERHMHARGMSVRATARAAGYSDHTLVSKVLNGHKPVTHYLAMKLDRALSANGEITAAAQPAIADAQAAPRSPGRSGPVSPLTLPSAGPSASSLITLMPEFDRSEYVETRTSREELIAAVADESQEFGEWAGISEVADATISQYRDQARTLARVFEYEASVPLLLETARLRDRLTSRLRGHARLDQARELYLLAAQICGLLAWQTGDLGNYRAADTHAWTAWMCAEQARHDGARAWVRATQAKLAYWDGRFTESAQLAEDGLRYTASDSARVFLALFMARALARTGRRQDASSALATADAERGRVSEPDLLGGVWELTPGRYHGLSAGIWLLLDDADRAVTEAQEAIALGSAAPAGERHLYAELLVRTDQAVAHLRQPDLDGAATALRPVLDLPPGMRTEPLLQQLHQVRRMLALPSFADTASAVSLQGEIEIYDYEALPRQIAG